MGSGAVRRIASNVGLVLGSLVAALLATELLLRAWGFSAVGFMQPDRLLGWARIPGEEGWYTVEGRAYLRINAGGWRGPARSLEKPAGVTRIVVLGDSYTEGAQVAEDATFPSLLEHDLNRSLPGRYEVLNFGVAGFGTGQELLVLEHYALRYAPDAVVLAFTTGNDVWDNSPTLRRSSDSPYFRLDGDALVLDTSFLTSPRYLAQWSWRARTLRVLAEHCRIAQLARRARQGAQAARILAWRERRLIPSGASPRDPRLAVYRDPPPDSAWAHAWSVTERLVARIDSECRSRHIPFYLVTLSNPEQVTPDSQARRAFAAALGARDLFAPERRLERVASREGFDMLALAPLLSADAISRHEYYHGFGKFEGAGHWNERGHGMAAALLNPWLAARLPRPCLHTSGTSGVVGCVAGHPPTGPPPWE